MRMDKKGVLLVLSGPSGSGKGTVLKQLMQQQDNLYLSVSAATRAPRAGEQHGKDYNFIKKDAFEALIKSGEMLEYAKYCDNYYGTPMADVVTRCNDGIDVILEIEVQGAMQVKVRCPDAVLVFVMPPSVTELKRRLLERNTESAEAIERRLLIARDEIRCAARYDYIVVNDAVAQAAGDIAAIIRSEKNRTFRMTEMIDFQIDEL